MTAVTDAAVPSADCLTVDEVVALATRSGSHWFANDRFWQTYYTDQVWGGCLLVLADRDYTGRRLEWKVAHVTAGGQVEYLPAPWGEANPALVLADQAQARWLADQLEAGNPEVQRLDYDAHIECGVRPLLPTDDPDQMPVRCSFASWLVDGRRPLCSNHAGQALRGVLRWYDGGTP